MTSEVPIQVAIRVRPLRGNEVKKEPCLHCIPDKPQLILGKSKHFTFDYVFQQNTPQKDVYVNCVKPLISVFFEGYNTTVFAYGQTGSGKTYTMATGNRVYLDEDECGIIPRAVTDIFNTMEQKSRKCACKLRISFIEVYKEELKDLLEHSSSNVQIMDDENGNTVVMGVQEEVAQSVDEVLTLLDAGTAVRHVGSTNMNEESSRSHCIFTLILDQYPMVEVENKEHKGKRNVLSSRFHFVDLAGSERAQRTGNQGERFKESISINTGLLALGNVISSLAERKKDKHIPYRESKLTRILKDSLGGNSRTLMITCLSPAPADLDENINSLKYAERARKIRNTPIVNFDLEGSKINQMRTEIEVLRDQLQRKHSSFSNNNGSSSDMKKISLLEIENEKREFEQSFYLQQLHEISIILQAVEAYVALPPAIQNNLDQWRRAWQKYNFVRPITAPIRGSVNARPQNNILQNIRQELTKCKQQIMSHGEVLDTKDREIEDLKEHIARLQEVNGQMQNELSEERRRANENKEKLLEQQLLIESFRQTTGNTTRKSCADDQTLPSVLGASMTAEDRVMQSFRAKSELLISRVNDTDHVAYDDNISSDEEGPGDEIVQAHWNMTPDDATNPLISAKTFISQIPRPSRAGGGKVTPKGSNSKRIFNLALQENGFESGEDGGEDKRKNRRSEDSEDPIEQLESERINARDGVRTAEINVREVSTRMKELEQNILLKENLIDDLVQSEREARATSSTFRTRLVKLEKEYEKSKNELEDAQDKVNQFEKSSNKDAVQKTRLESDFKKKFKEMQKRYDELKQKEALSNKLSAYQENNEKKVKDMEAWIGRMKNQHIELDRKLKEESEKKSKYEQELTKHGLRIKELELKNQQQSLMLKRKKEEVVAATRKLRTNPDTAKISDALEQKKQYLDQEVEKIMAQQKEMKALEAELNERNESLMKREMLIREKEHLEVKRARSSQNLTKSIMQLSMQVDSVDERIQQLNSEKDKNNFSQDLKQLQSLKQDLVAQRTELQRTEDNGGLEMNESRRLVELGEAIEAVDEAIQFKNNLINEKRSTLHSSQGLVHPRENVEKILEGMGDLTPVEYKHLLGKQLSKVIELRKTTNAADDARYHYEIKLSDHEKKVYDLQRLLQVSEARHEKMQLEQNSKYEKDIQFLMEQLRVMASDSARDNHGSLEKKVAQLEKELYYYKSKTRKLKDHLKDTSISSSSNNNNNNNNDREEVNSREHERHERDNNNSGGTNGTDKKTSNGHHSNRSSESDFHLPNITSHHALVKKDSEKKLTSSDQTNVEEARRLQEIFDSKTSLPSSPSSHRSSRRTKKKNSKEDVPSRSTIPPDSMEVLGENPWAS